MPIRQTPTDDQLQKIAQQHLSWEALCLLDSLGYIKQPMIPTRMGIGVLWNHGLKPAVRKPFNHPMNIHDLSIHTRVIASFLKCPNGCTDGRHKDDVEAGDYISSWQGLDTLGSRGNWDVFNKSVAHLSLDRLNLPVMSPFERIRLAKETLKGLKDFINQLPEDKVGWFDDISKELGKHQF